MFSIRGLIFNNIKTVKDRPTVNYKVVKLIIYAFLEVISSLYLNVLIK